MKNIMVLSKTNKGEAIVYSTGDICPVCGKYQPDGELCVSCQKEYDIYKPRVDYLEIDYM